MGFMIYLILFLLSFVFMGLEIVAVRIITPYFGNSVYTWGSIISVFLIGSSIGYWLGGKSADISSHKTWLKRYFICCVLAVALIPHAAKTIMPYLQDLPEGMGTFIGASLLFILPNVLLSAIIPSLIKVGLSQDFSGTRIGSYHMISSVGSIMGTLITTFVLLPNVHVNALFALFVSMLISSFAFYLFQASKLNWMVLFWMAPVCLIPLISPQALLFPQTKLVAQISSPYHELYITEGDSYRDQQGSFRFLQFSKGGYQGGMNLNDPEDDIFPYVRNMSNIVDEYHPYSQNVFMIGHGIGSLTRKISNEGKHIEVAEIDEKVLEVSKIYFGYKGDEVKIGDGRVLLGKKEDGSIDVLLLDAYNGASIPFHLTTQEFFQMTKQKLKNDGIIVMNVIGRVNNDPFIQAIHTTVASVYSDIKIFAPDPSYKRDQNLFLVASSGRLMNKQLKESTEIKVGKGEIIMDGETKFIKVN